MIYNYNNMECVPRSAFMSWLRNNEDALDCTPDIFDGTPVVVFTKTDESGNETAVAVASANKYYMIEKAGE